MFQQPSRPGRPYDATVSTAYPPQLAGIPAFETTPYGICARIPVVTTPNLGDVAILFASDRDSHHMYLKLEKCDTAADPTRPLYCIPYRLTLNVFSLFNIQGGDYWNQFLAAPWKTIYFAHGPSETVSRVRLRMNCDTAAPFYIPPGTIAEFTQRNPGVQLVSATALANSPPPPCAQCSVHVGTLIFSYDST